MDRLVQENESGVPFNKEDEEMQVKVDVKKKFTIALKGIHVVAYKPGKQEVPEEAAVEMERGKFGTREPVKKEKQKKD